MFNLLRNRHKAFAEELAQRLIKEVPPGLIAVNRKALSVNKMTRMLERTFRSAAEYQDEHKLGMFRRAQFANDFKWGLKNGGYPEEFVDVAVEGLVVELSRRKAPAGGSGKA